MASIDNPLCKYPVTRVGDIDYPCHREVVDGSIFCKLHFHPRCFTLQRTEDVSGTSGVGTVAHGVQFQDGQCVLWWPNFGSMGTYKSADDLIAIHGHEGRTKMVFAHSA